MQCNSPCDDEHNSITVDVEAMQDNDAEELESIEAADRLEKEKIDLLNELEAIAKTVSTDPAKNLSALVEFVNKLEHILEMPFGPADQQARRDMILELEDAAQLKKERRELSIELESISNNSAALKMSL
jgi:hypothetical protein